MTGKKLLILVVVLLVVAGAAAGVHKALAAQDESQAQDTAAESMDIVPADSAEITVITWTYDGVTTNIVPGTVTTEVTSTDGAVSTTTSAGWVYGEDTSYEIDQSFPDAMATAAASLTTASEMEDSSDLAAYGLDAPQVMVTVIAAEQTYSFSFGNQTSLGGQRYLLYDGKVYTADESYYTPFAYTPETMQPAADE
jgi:Tfp pilus assembly protein PilV